MRNNDDFLQITAAPLEPCSLCRNTDHVQPSYTKLSSTGDPLPDSSPSWAMVQDNVTGLIWEVKRNMDGVTNYDDPNDADNTYYWYDGNPKSHGGSAGTQGNGTNTETFINALNMIRFGSYSDWRLPTIKELAYLADSKSTNPAINTKYFPNTASSWYWSSSTSVNYLDQAWGVGFLHGYDSYNYKHLQGYVRAVRAARKEQNVLSGFLKFHSRN